MLRYPLPAAWAEATGEARQLGTNLLPTACPILDGTVLLALALLQEDFVAAQIAFRTDVHTERCDDGGDARPNLNTWSAEPCCSPTRDGGSFGVNIGTALIGGGLGWEVGNLLRSHLKVFVDWVLLCIWLAKLEGKRDGTCSHVKS